MRSLRLAVVVAALLWPLLLGAAVWLRATGRAPVWTTVVYVAASRICHQQPSRSFSSAGVPWPVCGRCSGLYAAAPLGVWLGRRRLGRSRETGSRETRPAETRSLLLLAAVPTLVTLALEWLALAPVSNAARALAALPLGAAIAATIVRVLDEPPYPIRYTGRA